MSTSYENNKSYLQDIDKALDDDFLRHILDVFALGYRQSRTEIFNDIDSKKAIQDVSQRKKAALAQYQTLYQQFQAEAQKRGAVVLWANDAREANALIADIAKEHKIQSAIKSKSMTSEEIGLNASLESQGVKCYETDLGEWICQIRGESPSHMVLPSIHLSRQQVAGTFTQKVEPVADENNIADLVKLARRNLRKYFAAADLAISGANFCIAESGTIGIATNEGNARLVSTLPNTYIVLTSLDKIVPSLEDALAILEVLPRNATAQYMTSYVNFISGAVPAGQEADSPQKRLYIIVLDNGRKNILAEPKFAEVLTCIRCGACANVCPVFRLVGGHRMGYIYVGAIGLILTYFYHGPDKAKFLVQNCLNCGACKEVCGAGIDLPAMIEEIRMRIEKDYPHLELQLMSKVMKNRKLFHSLLSFAKYAQKPLADGEYIRHLPSIFDKSLGFRTLPALAPQAFRDKFASLHKTIPNPKYKIALFAGCVQDFVYPQHLEAALQLFQEQNVAVAFPEAQNCCGLPVLMMGQRALASDIAQQNIQAFQADYDYVVTLCASCASHIKHGYVRLGLTSELSAKIIDFSSFVVDILGLENIKTQPKPEKIAYHASCHLCRGLGVTAAPREIIRANGEYAVSLEEDLCCGFGGTYSVKFPAISANLLERKLKHLQASQAKILVADCPGCILQLKGAMQKNKIKIEVKHIAELF